MNDVNGTWECTAETPLGEQNFTLKVRREGAGFIGRASGKIGAMQIDDGEVEGEDTLVWTMRLTKPMPVTLDCRASVEGDKLQGKVKAGFMGSYKIWGNRTA